MGEILDLSPVAKRGEIFGAQGFTGLVVLGVCLWGFVGSGLIIGFRVQSFWYSSRNEGF